MISNREEPCTPVPRLLVIDYFRGLAVFLMLVYDYVPFFTKDVPLVFQHGRTDRLLFGDFVAPFFLFIMGASLAFTTCKRRTQGVAERELFLQVLRRAGLLLLVGLIIDETRAPLLGSTFGLKWGVLETLGVSYLIAYLIMRFKKTSSRIIVTGGLLGLHLGLMMVVQWYRNFVETSAHGSPFSVLSWAAIAVFGMMAGEQLTYDRRDYERYLYRLAAALIIAGTLLAQVDPPRKQLVSASYALVTSGGSAFMLMLMYYAIETRKTKWLIKRMRPFREFGVAALLAWILQYVLAAPFIYYFYRFGKAAPLYGIPLALTMIGVVWLVIREANRRGIGFKI